MCVPVLDLRWNVVVVSADERDRMARVFAYHGRRFGLFFGAGFHLGRARLCLGDNPKGYCHVPLL